MHRRLRVRRSVLSPAYVRGPEEFAQLVAFCGVPLTPADEKRPYGFKWPAVSRTPSDALLLDRSVSGLIMLRLFKGIGQEGVDYESDHRRFSLVCSVSVQQH